MNLTKLVNNPRAVQAVIGMSYQEFTDLVPEFETALYVAAKRRRGRRRLPGAGQKGVLTTTSEKLFFILFYLKVYPTFDVLAFLFNRNRGRSCEYVHRYLKVLEEVLGRHLVLPERKIHSIEEFLEAFPDIKDVFPDGTERRIQKPKNVKRNRRMYSGKKKAHTRKNVVVVSDKKRILMMTPTKPGRRHDKRAADNRLLGERIPPHVDIWTDTGFQGLQHLHPRVHTPQKATKKHPLTPQQREENRLIASFRVVSEHALSGMKRFGVVSQVLRNKLGRFDDRAAFVCAGLWNLHLRYQI